MAAVVELGFDGVKFDDCGAQRDMSEWTVRLNATGRRVMVEQCHWGRDLPTAASCPSNYWRASGDATHHWGSLVSNVNATAYLGGTLGLSRPGCWGYADMLMVGSPGFTHTEWRAHFFAWAIVSSR